MRKNNSKYGDVLFTSYRVVVRDYL